MDALFELPCTCQNLRRLTRVVTRVYDQELRKAGLEITRSYDPPLGTFSNGAQAVVQGLEVDRRVFERGDQEHGATLVLEEQVFRVPARNGAPQSARFLDGEQRRVRHGPVRDGEAIEEGEKIIGGRRHGGASIEGLKV